MLFQELHCYNLILHSLYQYLLVLLFVLNILDWDLPLYFYIFMICIYFYFFFTYSRHLCYNINFFRYLWDIDKWFLSAERDGGSKDPLPQKDFTLSNIVFSVFHQDLLSWNSSHILLGQLLTFLPSGISYSFIRSCNIWVSAFLNCSETILSVSLLISSNSLIYHQKSIQFQILFLHVFCVLHYRQRIVERNYTDLYGVDDTLALYTHN